MNILLILLLILFPFAASAQLDTVSGYWDNWDISTQYNAWDQGTGTSTNEWRTHFIDYIEEDPNASWPEGFELPPRFLSVSACADNNGDLWLIDENNSWSEYEGMNCHVIRENYDNWGNQYSPRILNWRVAVTEDNGDYYLIDIGGEEFDTVATGGEELLTLKRSSNSISYSNILSDPPFLVTSFWDYSVGFAYLDTIIIHSGNVLDMTYSGGDIWGLVNVYDNTYIMGTYCVPCYTWEDRITFEADSLVTGIEVQEVVIPVSGLIPTVAWGSRDLDARTKLHFFNGEDLSDDIILEGDISQLRVYGTSSIVSSGGDLSTYYAQSVAWTEYDSNTDTTYPNFMHFTSDLLSVAENQFEIPAAFSISSLYPNPFNSSLSFNLETYLNEKLNIAVFDMLGRQISTLHNGEIAAGKHKFMWNAGSSPSGTYFIRINNGQLSESRKVILIK